MDVLRCLDPFNVLVQLLIDGVNDEVRRVREDIDPQSVFYLNLTSANPTSQPGPHGSVDDILVTAYS